ncbi:hypothetical protein [Vibrio coralliilyticus]|uniref:hypothetical protein n=1 Tax=Vibrio coralliilyticus TaxID=190893 RepID=UPI001E3F3B99|nr:hypothetical protein [Vibrio coralliilyticus]MCC2524928.1 hypothetical protein [Vibrio coralliilyticus]
MLNIYNKNAVGFLVASAIDTDFVNESDYKRVKYDINDKLRFDIYLTLSYLGFFSSEQHSYQSVLESIPKEFLPCDVEQSETFHITSASISRIVTQFSPFIKNNLSAPFSDIDVLKDIQSRLPMTLNEINQVLIKEGVVLHPISQRAVEFLFDCFIEPGAVSSLLISKSNRDKDANGERYERNSRPSIKSVCVNDRVKDFKNLSDSIVRYCETLGRLIGIVDFQLVFDLVLHLNGELIKDLKLDKSSLHDYVSSICIEKYGVGRHVNYGIHESISESSAYEFMYKYLSVVGQCSYDDVPEFLIRILRFKSIRKTKETNRVISSSVILEYLSFDSLSSERAKQLVSSFDFVQESDGFFTLSDKVFVDIEREYSIAPSVLLEYISSEGGFNSQLSIEERTQVLLEKYAFVMKSKLNEALNNPDGFFEKTEQGYSVSEANSEKKQNYSGSYIRPDYDHITDELYNENVVHTEDDGELKSRFKILFSAFKKKWSKVNNLSDLLVDESLRDHDEYISDRRELLTTTHFRSCENWLKSELKRAKFQIASNVAYINYLQSQGEKQNSVSVEHLNDRIEKWHDVLDVLELELKLVYASSPYTEYETHSSEVSRLLEERARLAIKPGQYRAHIAIYDYLSAFNVGVIVTHDEMIRFVDSYCASLIGDFSLSNDKRLVSGYHNLRRLFKECVEHHPFSIVKR